MALECNLKPGLWNWWRNRKFRRRYLKKVLKVSQIEFLNDQIGELEYGEEYKDLKKKGSGNSGERIDPDVIRGLISTWFGIDYWLVDDLPFSWYREMLEQAINQGCWRGGSKLRLTKGQVEGTGGDPTADFYKMVKAGKIHWMCKDCSKRKEKCTCRGEREIVQKI